MLPSLRVAMPLWRRVVIAMLLVYGLRFFLREIDEHYAIEDWLFWHYGRYWLWCAVFSLGCFATGDVIVRRLAGRLRGLHFHAYASFCVGVFVFGLLIFLTGLPRLFGPTLFYALPLGMVAIGAKRIWHYQAVLRPRLARLAPARFTGLWPFVVVAFGAYGFLLVYSGVLSPENAMMDARWKHLTLAETYAAHGGIMRFPEGWLFSTRPHFASFLYTWAFMIPDGLLFDRIELAAHIEFTVFLWTTLLGIPALVRWLIPDADPKLVWVARFLFPGVFLYDSNLSIGADHVGATFVIAIVLLTHEAVRKRFHLGYCVLLGAMLAAITLTKETACLTLLPTAVVWVAISMIRQAVARRPGDGKLRWLLGPLVISLTAIVLTAPFWLTNWVWHGDPAYPNLHHYLTPRPWEPDAAYMFDWGYKDFQFSFFTQGDRGRLVETMHALYNWSFEPNDWAAHHGDRPVIGSLVTLLLPILPFLRGTKRVWAIAIWIHVGIIAWFNLLPQDRYLQAVMPIMAAFTAAILVLAWRQRVRVALVGLVALQIVWGGDVYFLYRNQLKNVVQLFAASHGGDMDARLRTMGGWNDIGDALPADARLLVHEVHPHLGSNVVTIPDFQTWMFGISYGLMKSPRDVWERYREMGITHVFWRGTKSRAWDSLAGDIMFFTFARQYTVNVKVLKKRATIGEMPETPPPDASGFPDRVAVLTCRNPHLAPGEYVVSDLNKPMFGPERDQYPPPRVPVTEDMPIEKLVARADYVVVEPRCINPIKDILRTQFVEYAKRERHHELKNRVYQIWARQEGPPPAADPDDDGEDGEDGELDEAPVAGPGPGDDDAADQLGTPAAGEED